jgi:hypothetical protein
MQVINHSLHQAGCQYGDVTSLYAVSVIASGIKALADGEHPAFSHAARQPDN